MATMTRSIFSGEVTLGRAGRGVPIRVPAAALDGPLEFLEVRLRSRYEPAPVSAYPVRSGPLMAGQYVCLPAVEAEALVEAGCAIRIAA